MILLREGLRFALCLFVGAELFVIGAVLAGGL